MGRKYIDCRQVPSEMNCTVTISADTEKELMDIAVQHAVASHGHKDTPEFLGELKKAFKEGSPLTEVGVATGHRAVGARRNPSKFLLGAACADGVPGRSSAAAAGRTGTMHLT